jgi:hypothetical protein
LFLLLVLENYALQLLKTDIIPLVNRAWPGSFGNIEGNKKALAERGWYPYNRNLLLNSRIRATMTQQQLNDEKELGLIPTERQSNVTTNQQQQLNNQQYISISNNTTVDPEFNYEHSLTDYCLQTLTQEQDRQKARERAYRNREKGKITSSLVKDIRGKMTAGKLVIQGRSHSLDMNVLEQARAEDKIKKGKQFKLKRKNEFLYLDYCARSDAAFERNGNTVELMHKWRKVDVLDFIRPLKVAADGKMPTTKKKGLEVYQVWKSRKRRSVDLVFREAYENSLVEAEIEDDMSLEEEDEKEGIANDETLVSM